MYQSVKLYGVIKDFLYTLIKEGNNMREEKRRREERETLERSKSFESQ